MLCDQRQTCNYLNIMIIDLNAVANAPNFHISTLKFGSIFLFTKSACFY